jgi:hypothetical protein
MDASWLNYGLATLLVVVGMLVLLGFVMLVASRLGWHQWSQSHPLPAVPDANAFWMRTGAFAWWSSYNNCLRVRFSPEGVFVRPIFPFIWFHPWIFLPWSERSEEQAGSWLFMFGGHRIVFRHSPSLAFTLHLPTAAEKYFPLSVEGAGSR